MASEGEVKSPKMEQEGNNISPAPQSGGRYRSRSRSPTEQNKQRSNRRDSDRSRNDRNQDRNRNRDRERDRRPRPMGDNRRGMGQGGAGRGGPREAVLERSVFVSNIPYELKWQDLKDEMRKNVGEVTYVEIFTADDGKSRGCGLVEFADRTNVGKACDKMHRHEIDGRAIVVKEDRDGRISRKYRQRGPDDRTAQMLNPQVLQQLNLDPEMISDTVFVSNLAYQVTWKKLKDIFKMAGEVVHADILEDENHESRGLATVQFESPHGAVQAISMFNGQSLYERTMRVRMDKVKAQEDHRERNRKILPSGLGGLGPTLDMLGPSAGGSGMGMMGNMGGRQMGGGIGGGGIGGGGIGGGGFMGGNMGMGGGGLGMGSGGNLGIGSGGLGGTSNMGGGIGGNIGLGIGGSGIASLSSNLGIGGGGSGGNFGNGLNTGLGSNFGGGGGFGNSNNLGNSSIGGIGGIGGGGGSLSLANTSLSGYNSGMNTDLAMNLSSGRGDFGNFGGNSQSSILGEPRGQNLRDSGRQNFRDNCCQVLVRNLPFSYDWKKLKDSFRHIAPVVYAEVRTENGRSKGYGLVKFEVPEDARKAVEEMNRVRFDGREIIVQLDN